MFWNLNYEFFFLVKIMPSIVIHGFLKKKNVFFFLFCLLCVWLTNNMISWLVSQVLQCRVAKWYHCCRGWYKVSSSQGRLIFTHLKGSRTPVTDSSSFCCFVYLPFYIFEFFIYGLCKIVDGLYPFPGWIFDLNMSDADHFAVPALWTLKLNTGSY